MKLSEIASIAGLSLQVSLLATVLIAVPAIAVGYVLSRVRFRGRTLLRTFVSLPMVLPPVAVGFLLLTLFSKNTALGEGLAVLLGGSFLLTWKAAVIAASVMAFPLAVLGAERGFDVVPRRQEQVAASLGATPVRVFREITLPIARGGILHGLAFAFVRALGEFGATVLVAGNVPGRTQTLSMAIFTRIEDFRDREALVLSLLAIVFALAVTGAAEWVLRRPERCA
jgi:molybdate transport system permease protein